MLQNKVGTPLTPPNQITLACGTSPWLWSMLSCIDVWPSIPHLSSSSASLCHAIAHSSCQPLLRHPKGINVYINSLVGIQCTTQELHVNLYHWSSGKRPIPHILLKYAYSSLFISSHDTSTCTPLVQKLRAHPLDGLHMRHDVPKTRGEPKLQDT